MSGHLAAMLLSRNLNLVHLAASPRCPSSYPSRGTSQKRCEKRQWHLCGQVSMCWLGLAFLELLLHTASSVRYQGGLTDMRLLLARCGVFSVRGRERGGRGESGCSTWSLGGAFGSCFCFVTWQVSAQLLTLLLLSSLERSRKRRLKRPPGAALALSSRARWRIRLDVDVRASSCWLKTLEAGALREVLRCSPGATLCPKNKSLGTLSP